MIYSELCRVLSNLLNNAYEASKNGDPITIDICNQDNDWIKILIKDKGVGIPNELLDKVFEQGVSFKKKTGSGFGLYHSKLVLNKMNGSIKLDSNVNNGTTVHLTIPKLDCPIWGINELYLSDMKQIVLIDDEDVNQKLWKKKLHTHNINLLYYNHPSIVPNDLLRDRNTVVLLDNSFENDHGLGLRFAEKTNITNCILVTNDWAVYDIQSVVQKLKIKLLAKDFVEQIRIVT